MYAKSSNESQNARLMIQMGHVMSSITRKCKTCGNVKVLNRDNFYFNRRRNYFETQCKECAKARLRDKYANDLNYRESAKAYQRKTEVRARKNQTRKDRYSNHPEYRSRVLSVQNERYANDPDYREAIKAKRRTPEARFQEE